MGKIEKPNEPSVEVKPVVIGIEFEITGTYPLLQHRFGEYAEASLAGGTKAANKVKEEHTPRQWAEINAYRLSDGTIGHPASAITRAMRDAGVNYKTKGTRSSLKAVVPAAIRYAEEFFAIYEEDAKTRLKKVEVDSRSVVNQKAKVRVMCHRARIEHWVLKGKLTLDTELLSSEMAQRLMEDAGRRLGIGAFRPQSGGPFGCFRVTSWKEVLL